MSSLNRRDFLKHSAAWAAGAGLLGGASPALAASPGRGAADPLFRLSLAEWSFHKALFGKTMDNLDFAPTARRLGFEGVEYVNQFFKDRAKDSAYLAQMKQRAADAGVRNVLIMCDGEGNLGDPDAAKRAQAVENHYKWVDAAKYLGCHSIRVNAASRGSYDEQVKLAADGLRRLTEYGDGQGINVIVENHGGLSSNGAWLAAVMKQVNHPRVGTLPDFGNFRISPQEEYDRYQGTRELMPFAKGVSAKSLAFNDKGEESTIDYPRMMKIVLDAGYRGFVGVEYEGSQLGEEEGILATRKLLERLRDQLTPQYQRRSE